MTTEQQQQQQQHIEISFRLDGNGRTCLLNSSENSTNTGETRSKDDRHGTTAAAETKKAKITAIDYRTKVCCCAFRTVNSSGGSSSTISDHRSDNPSTSFSALPQLPHEVSRSKDEDDDMMILLLDDLLMDSEISDCGLMPRTFWVPAAAAAATAAASTASKNDDRNDSFRPRFSLEQMAADVFRYHVPDDVQYDANTSGSEWWVQIRPSPEKTGRYSMHDHSHSKHNDGNGNNNNTNDKKSSDNDMLSNSGICFHWDKDEDLRLLCGGTTYVHPHLSTVTYLTSIGAPTLTINCRVHPLTGEWLLPSNRTEGDFHEDGGEEGRTEMQQEQKQQQQYQAFVCWPAAGKHLSFDGRFLHAAPADLMPHGSFERQCQAVFDGKDDRPSPTFKNCSTTRQVDANSERNMKTLRRRRRRVTFLVNIWLNHRPFGVEPFPETMIDKMSGHHRDGNNASCGDDDYDKNGDDSRFHCRRRVGLSFESEREKDSDDETSLLSSSVRVVSIGHEKQTEERRHEQQPRKQKVSSSLLSSLCSNDKQHNITTRDDDYCSSSNNDRTFTWPMGDCDSGETIQVTLPLQTIQAQQECGGNVDIHWSTEENGVILQQQQQGSGAPSTNSSSNSIINNNKSNNNNNNIKSANNKTEQQDSKRARLEA